MLNFNPQTVSLCVIQQHHDFWAPLVAFDWASGLICIIRISQLWNSFDLPPSLVTEWERVSLLPPSRLPFSPSSIHHTHFFTVLHVHYLFPWCPNLFFTHIVVILCSFTLIYFNPPRLISWFSSHFVLHPTYLRCNIKEVSAILLFYSLSSFHLS